MILYDEYNTKLEVLEGKTFIIGDLFLDDVERLMSSDKRPWAQIEEQVEMLADYFNSELEQVKGAKLVVVGKVSENTQLGADFLKRLKAEVAVVRSGKECKLSDFGVNVLTNLKSADYTVFIAGERPQDVAVSPKALLFYSLPTDIVGEGKKVNVSYDVVGKLIKM
jgi:hypothetical protein